MSIYFNQLAQRRKSLFRLRFGMVATTGTFGHGEGFFRCGKS